MFREKHNFLEDDREQKKESDHFAKPEEQLIKTQGISRGQDRDLMAWSRTGKSKRTGRGKPPSIQGQKMCGLVSTGKITA